MADRADPTRTIVLIYNHGFSRERAGTYEALVPPILQQALERNSDVVLFSQVRNTPRLGRTQHGDYIEAAIAQFRRRDGVPLENIILVGQKNDVAPGELYRPAERVHLAAINRISGHGDAGITKIFYNIRRAVPRTVIHDDDFVTGAEFVQNRAQLPFDILLALIGRHANA